MLNFKRDIKEVEAEMNEKFPIKIDYKYAQDILDRVAARCPDNIPKADVAKVLKSFFKILRRHLIFSEKFALFELIARKEIYYSEALRSVKCIVEADDIVKYTIECNVEDIFKRRKKNKQ